MYEYTYDDVNFIGGSERVANALGKECYYGFSAKQVLENAQNGRYGSILKWVDNDSYKPFGDAHGGWYPFMIVKQEPEPKYVPFTSKEEFLEKYLEVKNDLESDSFEGGLLQCGMWLKIEGIGSDGYCMVTELWGDGVVLGYSQLCTTKDILGKYSTVSETTSWEDLCSGFTFLDGSPCGRLNKVQ